MSSSINNSCVMEPVIYHNQYSQFSFWKDKTVNIFNSGTPSGKFIDCQRNIIIPQSPTNTSVQFVSTDTELSEISRFLYKWFGYPPNTPLMVQSFSDKTSYQCILYIRDISGGIVGTIRYRETGKFENETIHTIDCFCTHPSWRKRGISSYLLAVLHQYVNMIGRKWSMFLKEGNILPIFYSPFYSSIYRYRQVCSNSYTPNTINILPKNAHRFIKVFKTLRPDDFFILNIVTPNQIWRLYRNGGYWAIAVFQDSYQIHPYNYGKIGWCTGYIESIGFPDKYRKDALFQLSEFNEFAWIWVDSIWVHHTAITEWAEDGPFHWYLYQWNTSAHISRNYCIMV